MDKWTVGGRGADGWDNNDFSGPTLGFDQLRLPNVRNQPGMRTRRITTVVGKERE